MYRKPLVIAALCVLFAQAAAGQATDIYWEIGKEPKVSVPREPGTYRLILLGRVNGGNYQADVTLESIPIPPLVQPSTVARPAATFQPPPPQDDPCKPYNDKVGVLVSTASARYNSPDLKKATAEEEFLNARTELQSAIENPFPGCVADPLAILALADLVNKSRWELGTYTIVRGQVLTAKVSRKLGSESREQEFVYKITTGSRGAWQASYGFGITPNNDEHFYSKAGDDDTFVVTKKHENGGVNPTAAVFYTWLPRKRENSNLNFGVAAGIGIDQSNLALFLGGHMTFNQNVGLVAGIAVHQETRLRGEFETGQSVTDNLTGDALEEKVFEPTWFIGLTMRFAASEK